MNLSKLQADLDAEIAKLHFKTTEAILQS